MAAPVLVLGLGNPDRGDDAVGPAVAERLQGRVPDGVIVRARSSDPLALIEDWRGFDRVVLIDAAAPQGRPGRISCLDLARETLPPDVNPASTHIFGLAEAVSLAAALGERPRHLILIAIEAVDFSFGAPISPPVADALDRAVALALREVDNLTSAVTAA